MKNLHITIVALVLAVICFVSRAAGAPPIEDSFIVRTAEEAIARALAYSGFSTLRQCSVDTASVRLVVLDDDQTPWLHNELNGKKLWQVKVDVTLELLVEGQRPEDTLRRFDEESREFTIYLDPETGQILKMTSDPGEYPHKPFKPPAEVGEWVLGSWREKFVGFPEKPPKVTFLEALRMVIGDPLAAKEIQVVYMLWSRFGSEPRPVWSIDLRGLDQPAVMPSHYAMKANIPVEQLNHMRTIVCAETGRHLWSTDLPQSLIPEMYKRSHPSEEN